MLVGLLAILLSINIFSNKTMYVYFSNVNITIYVVIMIFRLYTCLYNVEKS